MFHTLGQSLPPGVFGPSQMHCILCNKKWDYILTTSSGPLHLPQDGLPVLSRVFYCSVIGTSRFPTAQTVLPWGVLSAWSSLCLMSPDQTCAPPHPSLGSVLFAFDGSTCWGYFQLLILKQFLRPFSAFCSRTCLFYKVVIGSYFAFSTSSYAVGTVPQEK